MSEHLARCIVRIGSLMLIVMGLVSLASGLILGVQGHFSNRSVGFDLGDASYLLLPSFVPLVAGFLVWKSSGWLASMIVEVPSDEL